MLLISLCLAPNDCANAIAFISDLEITETGIYTPQTRWINAIVVTGPKWSSKNNRNIHH
jgi:hypothetical protein